MNANLTSFLPFWMTGILCCSVVYYSRTALQIHSFGYGTNEQNGKATLDLV